MTMHQLVQRIDVCYVGPGQMRRRELAQSVQRAGGTRPDHHPRPVWQHQMGCQGTDDGYYR